MDSHSVVNREQAAEWNGEEGRHWAEHAERYDALNGGFTGPLLAAAGIGRGHVVIDIGCGNGETTRRAAQHADQGRATGLDLSARMLQRAAELAASEDITNVSFEQGDAQIHPFDSDSYDIAVSRFGVMFFANPAAAFANIARALRSGGRLAFACWQDLVANPWLTTTAGAALEHVPMPDLGAPGAPGPFSLADPDGTSALLRAAGFDQVDVNPVAAPMRLGDDASDAVTFLRGSGIGRALLANADPGAARRAVDAVREALIPHQTPKGVYLEGAAWLVTARAA